MDTNPQIALGQVWQAQDHRAEYQHLVEIVDFSVARGVQIRRVGAHLTNGVPFPARWAKASRFNGRSGGYKFISNGVGSGGTGSAA